MMATRGWRKEWRELHNELENADRGVTCSKSPLQVKGRAGNGRKGLRPQIRGEGSESRVPLAQLPGPGKSRCTGLVRLRTFLYKLAVLSTEVGGPRQGGSGARAGVTPEHMLKRKEAGVHRPAGKD